MLKDNITSKINMKHRLKRINFKPPLLYISFFILLSSFTLIWFGKHPYLVLAGDDLELYLKNVQNTSFFGYVFSGSGVKIRILSLILLYIIKIFGCSYKLYYYFNIGFLILLSFLILLIVKKISKNYLFSFLAGLLFISSRFSLYLVYQVYGAMEILALSFGIFLYLCLYQFVIQDDPKKSSRYLFFSVLLFACLLQSHERYMVNIVVIFMAIILKNKLTIGRRFWYWLCSVTPLILHYFIAYFWMGGNVMNVGQQSATQTLYVVPEMFTLGLINLLGINMAPQWMGGVIFGSYSPFYLLTGLLSIIPLGFILVKYISSTLKWNWGVLKSHNFQSAILIFGGMAINIAPFAITSRQEQRFLAFSFILFLVGVLMCASRIDINPLKGRLTHKNIIVSTKVHSQKKYSASKNISGKMSAVFFILLSFICNIYFFKNKDAIYYFTAQRIAEKSNEIFTTEEQENGSIDVKKVYVVGIRDADWALGHGYLFQYYSKNTDINTVFINDISEVPTKEFGSEEVVIIGYDNSGAITEIDPLEK